MAYYTGTANSYADLRSSLLTHAQADGWVLTGDVLSKEGVFFRITATAESVACLGCESNAVGNPAPHVVQIGRMVNYTMYGTLYRREISWPCTYHVFGFDSELYLVVNYDLVRYQWMAFGKTTLSVPGKGGWCGATYGSVPGNHGPTTGAARFIGIGPSDGGFWGAPAGLTSAALFWVTGYHYQPAAWNWFVNHDLDGLGWYFAPGGNAPSRDFIGIRYLSELLTRQPNLWNSEAALLPLRCYIERPSFKSSMLVDLAHARHVRLDNCEPGDVLTIGPDRWMVFPWYTKDAARRNGTAYSTSDLSGTDHSGTLGWAIRYEGP